MMQTEFHCYWTDETFHMWFLAPRQLLLNQEWEQMVWDETLKQAHKLGVIPVGSVLIEAEELGPQQALVEGHPMVPHGMVSVGMVDVIKVKSEVMVGTVM